MPMQGPQTVSRSLGLAQHTVVVVIAPVSHKHPQGLGERLPRAGGSLSTG